MNKLKVGSCFTGIGAWEKAFEYLGIDYDLKFFCEFDKYPIKSYIEMFNEDENKNIGDITKANVENLPDIDVFCYSPPCQAFSIAGKQLGFEDKRGILFFESLKIIQAKKPKYCLMENVKGLTTKKFNAEFQEMLKALEETGYKNHWKVLNTKDYGLPQNRERVFVISIRNDIEQEFEFPVGFDNGIRLKDILESEVDEKYYIAQEKCDKLIQQFLDKGQDFSYCIDANYWKGTTPEQYLNKSRRQLVTVPNILRPVRTEYGKEIRKQYENGEIQESRHNMTELQPREDGISNTLTTVQKDNLVCIPCITPDIVEKRQNGRRFKEDGEPMFTLTSQDRHGILQIGMLDIKGNESIRRVYDEGGISPSLTTMQGGNRQPKVMVKEATKKGYAIAYEGDSINLEQPNSKTRRGRVGKQVAQTLTCSCNQATLIPNKNKCELYNLLLMVTVINDIINLEGVDYIEDEKRKSRKILQTLWEINGTEKIFDREIRRTLSLQEKSILRQRVHEKGLFKYRTKQIKLEQFTYNSEKNSRREYTDKAMRDLWKNFKTRCSPQRWGLSEQQNKEFNDVMQKLSCEDTQAKKRMCNMWRTNERVGVLQQALSEIQEIWRSINDEAKESLQDLWRTSKCERVMCETLSRNEAERKFRIRKLTPLETWRLQGFKDSDFEKAQAVNSNSQLYKQAGNSISVNVLMEIYKILFKEYIKEDKQC